MRAVRCLGFLLCGSLLLVGCASSPVASQPRMPAADASVNERQRTYERYRLQESGDNWVGHEWARSDGKYGLDGIEPLLDISAQTRSRVSQAKTRAAVVLPMSAVGGALLGLAIGNQLTGNKMYSSTTNTVLYVSGGTLAVAAITIGIVWDPVSGIGDVYNAALTDKLGLRPDAAQPPSR